MKKNKKKIITLISTGSFLVLGTIAFFIGAKLSGWNIWGWFSTPQAYLIYALLGVGLLLGISLLIRMKLGGDRDE